MAVGRSVIVLPAVEIPKDSIAKYETALQDGRNPADRPRDGSQNAEAVAANRYHPGAGRGRIHATEHARTSRRTP